MIVVLGALNVDIMMPIDKFPQLGETVVCNQDYVTRSGGKGSNHAVAAARAEAKVAMIGKVGDDSFGRRAVKNLKSYGIWTSGIGTSDLHPTGCSTVAVDKKGRNAVICDLGANMEVTGEQVPDEILNERNILLTSLELNQNEICDVLKRANLRKCTTILNASPANNLITEMLYNIDYLIVNEVEAGQIATMLNIKEKNPHELARKLASDFDFSCIITLEERGAVAASGGVLYTIPPLVMEDPVVDSTGAGDTFCGVFAACLQKDMGWIEALHYASAAAGLSCRSLGAQNSMPDFADIKERLNDVRPPEKLNL